MRSLKEREDETPEYPRFNWQELLKEEIEVEKPAQPPAPAKAALFLDTTNLMVRSERFDNGTKDFYFIRYKWNKLAADMEAHLQGAKITHRAAYARSGWFERADTASSDGRRLPDTYEPVVDPLGKNDADILMQSDIWDHVVKSHLEAVEQGYERFAVHHVIGSGDGDLIRPYQQIMDRYGSIIDLKITVYVWSDSLNYQLRRLVGGHNICDLTNRKDLRE